MMSATKCLRCQHGKKRYGKGHSHSHGRSGKMKTIQHKRERRAIRTAIASGREVMPRIKPLSCWYC